MKRAEGGGEYKGPVSATVDRFRCCDGAPVESHRAFGPVRLQCILGSSAGHPGFGLLDRTVCPTISCL
jgi:hypothetical protein